MTDTPENTGARRPKDEDLEPILEMIWEGKSLRAACRSIGLHVPSTSDWLYADKGRSEQYVRAREGRAEFQQEQSHEISLAAATGKPIEIDGEEVVINPVGARVFLDQIKWSTARMAPKTAPVQRIDLTSRTRLMTDAEIAAEIAALEGGAQAED